MPGRWPAPPVMAFALALALTACESAGQGHEHNGQPVDAEDLGSDEGGEQDTGELPAVEVTPDARADDGGGEDAPGPGETADGCGTAGCPAGQTCTDAGCVAVDGDADGFTSDVDCDDADPFTYPDAPEKCDGKDNDCDGDRDEDFDADADGSVDCEEAGALADCDDSDPDIHPGADEVCDGKDNDCNGLTDDGSDADKDGYKACDADPSKIDCNDSAAWIYPGADELCNKKDDDCDGETDEGYDADGDGFKPCGTGEDRDCDDGAASVYPGAPESCNAVDDDCDGLTDEDFDADEDGYPACAPDPSDADCDDGDPAVHPGAEEACNSLDDDCDGQTDEITLCIGCSDGIRDDLTDIPHWPTVAACKGEFGRGSLRRDRTWTVCGDDLGVTCPAPEDLCAEGWHICMRNGSGFDLRFRLTSAECHALSLPYVAATANCSGDPNIDPATTGCIMNEPLPCYPTGWCSAPVACGPTETSHCAHAVWPNGTRIFGLHAGRTVNNGCGNISSDTYYDPTPWNVQGKLGGVLCCKD